MEGAVRRLAYKASRSPRLQHGAQGFVKAGCINRQAFGRQISDFQGIRWMLADMAMQTEAARQLTYKAASMVDAGVTGPELGKIGRAHV